MGILGNFEVEGFQQGTPGSQEVVHQELLAAGLQEGLFVPPKQAYEPYNHQPSQPQHQADFGSGLGVWGILLVLTPTLGLSLILGVSQGGRPAWVPSQRARARRPVPQRQAPAASVRQMFGNGTMSAKLLKDGQAKLKPPILPCLLV